ncbi:MAG TPA: hypothetical protein PKC21_10725 [Oligoflexia bacterium]|nr:hypothetical protein [Oligoflexia bacterium]HMR25810.1 hypothetical protein [Oligoflexia bacterium]
MVYLALQVLFWMIAAFILGLVSGWWMKKVLWITPNTKGQQLNYGRDEQLADMQDRLRKKQQKIENLEAQLSKLASLNVKTEPSSKGIKKSSLSTIKTKGLVNKTLSSKQTKDDLKKIYGIGRVIESQLNKLGITRFEHVAKLSGAQFKKVSGELDAFKDRFERDNWVASAKQCHYEKYGKDI